jgi:long-chain-alcohol oxidase
LRLSKRPKRPVDAVVASLARGVLGDSYLPEVPGRILESLDQLPSADDRHEIETALRRMDTRAGALLLTGRAVPVSWLSRAEAEKVLNGWRTSKLKDKRKLFSAVLHLAQSAVYSFPGPEWERIGYQGPMGPAPDEPRRLQPLTIDQREEMEADFVVVGSGAGGGLAAGYLATKGFDVVVLERGSYKAEADFDHLEAEASRDMYLYNMRLTTSDLGVQILAGRTLGGGTVVNYATSFKPPPFVLEQWAAESGIDAFRSGEMDEHLDAAARRVNVNTDSSAAGKRDVLLEEGLKQLGWHVDALPRAVKGCTQDEQCGFCGFGCRVGAKQSTMRTWLEDAAAAGARMVVDADVRKVVVKDGRAVAVEGFCNNHPLRVNARKAVIVAGGSIETPALLLRSGLSGEVGKNLRLHPGTGVFAVFDEDVRAWEGTLQARYSSEFRHWDDNYGPIFETVPVHPGAGSFVVPWSSAAGYRSGMGDFAKLGFVAVLPRDKAKGRVTISKDGAPKIEYSLTAGDSRRITEGAINAGKVMEAAGARKVYTLHHDAIAYTPGGPGAHERWAENMRARSYTTANTTLVSYHQMGSCRMGADPTRGAVDADNESHEVKDLYVVDGSTFPTASGVNPMLSIYGIAHRASAHIADRYS